MLAAETVARAGHCVYATMRQSSGKNAGAKQKIDQLAVDEKLDLHTLDLDVSDPASVQAAVDRVIAEKGRIDAIVNNAGIMSIGLSEAFTEEQMAQAMDVNVMGPFRLSRAALPHMRAQGSGLVINVTSILGRILFPSCGVYCATKFALEALTEVMHYELAGLGVETVLVEPGPYPSELLPNSPAPADKDRLAGYGPLATIREDLTAPFKDLYGGANAPRTQDVADAILGLIEMPAGQRPMRTVCGMDFGANALNDAVAQMQGDVLRSLQMGAMVPGKATQLIGKYPPA
ncbi:short-chain dehydrogenase/reductase [Bryobacterales bacterium F-183]|nr:short-chain dehydrogenase/reductase [Bryobacterales bacterium F-183]